MGGWFRADGRRPPFLEWHKHVEIKFFPQARGMEFLKTDEDERRIGESRRWVEERETELLHPPAWRVERVRSSR